MKALKIIGVILLVLIVLFFVVALFLPSSVHMEESMVMKQPSNLIFKQVNNFNNWDAWSPWLETDPEMQKTLAGPVMGVGASYSWVSKVHGDGQMTITESKPYEYVLSKLQFSDQEGEAKTGFYFTDTEDGTMVTWSVDIPHLAYPVERYFGLLMPGMMKPFFLKGLENLKKVTDEMDTPSIIIETKIPETMVITVLDSCNWSDFEQKMTEMYGELMGLLGRNKNVQMAGPPYTMYTKWDEANQFAVFEAGIPIDQEIRSRGRVTYKVLPETRAVMGSHFGRYDEIGPLYMALEEYINEFGLKEGCCPMEIYITDPTSEPDTSRWQTDVYYPIM